MLNPGTLVNSIVTILRDIPELVVEVGGDASRIYGYYGQFPTEPSLARALWAMQRPAVMVAYQGFNPGRRGGEVWKHSFSIYLRLRETSQADPPEAHYKALWLLVNGVPASAGGLRLLNAVIHADCDPMDVPSAQRQTMVIDDAGSSIDYFEFSFTLTEKGDA